MINKELLEILRCPLSKAPLILEGNKLISTDRKTRRIYRIENDIPVMLIDESEEMPLDEWEQIMTKHGLKVNDS